jgi:SET domain-containing protein
MNKIFTQDKIYIGISKIINAGRGVFAGCNIKKGEIIENCPIIEISKDNTSYLGESILVTYFFYFGKNKDRSGIALGFGSIYNHSYKPNAKFVIRPQKELIEFIALNDIKKDTEITFNYKGNENLTKSPLWFEF